MKILRGKYRVRTSHGHTKEVHHDSTNWLGLAIGESIIEHTLLETHDTPNFGVSDTLISTPTRQVTASAAAEAIADSAAAEPAEISNK